MKILIKRHSVLFLKDKTSVFFSLLSVCIIVMLYILFLSENIVANLPDFQGRASFVFYWMFAGIIAVTTATAVLGALGKFIEDKVNRKMEDFLITKITPRKLAYSYIMYTFLIGCILTMCLMVVGYLYAVFSLDNKLLLSWELASVVLLSTFMHTLLFYLITSNIKTMSAFSGFSTIVGTMIGFLAGIYIPIGFLPNYLQTIITWFPTTQAATLLKNLLMADELNVLEATMSKEQFEETVRMLGVRLQWDGQLIATHYSWIYLIGFTFLLLFIVLIKNRNKN